MNNFLPRTTRYASGMYDKIPARYKPEIWIDGANMYVNCGAMSGKYHEFSPKQEQDFVKLIHNELKANWGIDSQNLTLDLDPDKTKYRINFNDDEEFVMVKLMHG